MTDTTVQRLGIEFFGRIDTGSFENVKQFITDLDAKFKNLSKITVGDMLGGGLNNLAAGGQATVSSLGNVVKGLKGLGITAGMSFDQVGNLKLGILDLEKASKLLSTEANILRQKYSQLDAGAANYTKRAAGLNTVMERVSITQTGVKRQLDLIKGSFADAGRAAYRFGEGFGQMLRSQAAWLVGGAILFGSIAKITQGVRNFVELEDRLNRIRIISGGTTDQIKSLRDIILDLSSKTEFSNIQLSEASFFLVKYGLSIDQIIKTLPTLTHLSTVASGTIEENAKGVITILNAWGLSFDQAARVTNALTVALNKSALQMQDLSTIISTVASSAALFGQPIEQVLALSAALSNLGVKPSTIATGMRQLFSVLAKLPDKTNDLTEKLKAHGIALNKLHPAYNDLASILSTMADAEIDVTDLFKNMEIRIAGNTAAMLKALPSLRDLADEIRNSQMLVDQYAETLKSAEVNIKALSHSVDNLVASLLSADTGFATALKGVSRFILGINTLLNTPVLGHFVKLSISIVGIAAAFGGLLTKLIPAISNLTVLGSLLTFLSAHPIARLIIAIIGIATAMGLFGSVMKKLGSVTEDMTERLRQNITERQNELQEIKDRIAINNKLISANSAEAGSYEILNAQLRERQKLLEENNRTDAKRLAQQSVVSAAGEIEKYFEGKGFTPWKKGKFWERIPSEMMIELQERISRGEFKGIDDIISALSNKVLTLEEVGRTFPWMPQYQEVLKKRLAILKTKASEIPPEPIPYDFEKLSEQDKQNELKYLDMKLQKIDEMRIVEAEIADTKKTIAAIEKDQSGKYTDEDLKKLSQKKVDLEIILKQRQLELQNMDDQRTKERQINEERLLAIRREGDLVAHTQGKDRIGRIEAEIQSKQEELDSLRESLVATTELTERYKILEEIEKTLNEIKVKNNELTKAYFEANLEGYEALRRAEDRELSNKELALDLNKYLSDKEKELQKLLLQRVNIETKLVALSELLRKTKDPVEQKNLNREYNELLDNLGKVDMKLKSLSGGQRDWLRGFKDYVADAKTTWYDFVHDMEYQFSQGIENIIADWGKWLAYQGSQARKELQQQRDETLKDARARYETDKQALNEKLETGQLTYAKYYDELADLDEKYHDDIKSAQDQFENNMKKSLITISSLWEKFWRAMVDAAINFLAQQAVANIFSGLKGLWGTSQSPAPVPVSSDIVVTHSGGLVSDVVAGIKKFHDGGLSSNEVLAKLLKSEYVMRSQAVSGIGVNTLDYMNKTGQMPQSEIRIINVVDPSSIPTLSPDDVINIISFDVAKRGTTYNTLNRR